MFVCLGSVMVPFQTFVRLLELEQRDSRERTPELNKKIEPIRSDFGIFYHKNSIKIGTEILIESK